MIRAPQSNGPHLKHQLNPAYSSYTTTDWVNVSHLIITDKHACASRWVPRLIILSSQDHCVLMKQSERYQPSKAGCESSDVGSDRTSPREERQTVIINVCPSSRSSAVIQEVKWAWFRMSSPAGVRPLIGCFLRGHQVLVRIKGVLIAWNRGGGPIRRRSGFDYWDRHKNRSYLDGQRDEFPASQLAHYQQ